MKYCTFVCICGNDALKKNLRKKNPYLGSARKKNQSKEFLGANPIYMQKPYLYALRIVTKIATKMDEKQMELNYNIK